MPRAAMTDCLLPTPKTHSWRSDGGEQFVVQFALGRTAFDLLDREGRCVITLRFMWLLLVLVALSLNAINVIGCADAARDARALASSAIRLCACC